MIIYFPLLVSLVGLVMLLIATNPKVVEVGKVMFAAGLLAFLLHADSLVKVINK